MNIMANNGFVPAECILEYLKIRLDGETRDESGLGMYLALLKLLREQEHGKVRRTEHHQNQKGVMLL